MLCMSVRAAPQTGTSSHMRHSQQEYHVNMIVYIHSSLFYTLFDVSVSCPRNGFLRILHVVAMSTGDHYITKFYCLVYTDTYVHVFDNTNLVSMIEMQP